MSHSPFAGPVVGIPAIEVDEAALRRRKMAEEVAANVRRVEAMKPKKFFSGDPYRRISVTTGADGRPDAAGEAQIARECEKLRSEGFAVLAVRVGATGTASIQFGVAQ